jgi:hypothetical protein
MMATPVSVASCAICNAMVAPYLHCAYEKVKAIAGLTKTFGGRSENTLNAPPVSDSERYFDFRNFGSVFE